MKFNIRQKILSTIFACLLLFVSFNPVLKLTGVIASTLAAIFFLIALSDT